LTTVLLVEDNPIDAKAIHRACDKLDLDWEICSCTDGQSAIDHLSTEDSIPDFVLLDLNLPGLDGQDVLKELRSRGRYLTVPILVVTTSVAQHDVENSYRLGANAVITKPDDLAGWQNVLSGIHGFWINVMRANQRDGG